MVKDVALCKFTSQPSARVGSRVPPHGVSAREVGARPGWGWVFCTLGSGLCELSAACRGPASAPRCPAAEPEGSETAALSREAPQQKPGPRAHGCHLGPSFELLENDLGGQPGTALTESAGSSAFPGCALTGVRVWALSGPDQLRPAELEERWERDAAARPLSSARVPRLLWRACVVFGSPGRLYSRLSEWCHSGLLCTRLQRKLQQDCLSSSQGESRCLASGPGEEGLDQVIILDGERVQAETGPRNSCCSIAGQRPTGPGFPWSLYEPVWEVRTGGGRGLAPAALHLWLNQDLRPFVLCSLYLFPVLPPYYTGCAGVTVI